MSTGATFSLTMFEPFQPGRSMVCVVSDGLEARMALLSTVRICVWSKRLWVPKGNVNMLKVKT